MKKTILKSNTACLKKCEELLKKMREKGKDKFEDPDFGPAYKGDSARDSIYYGDIPPNYPDPEKIIWLRPDEIVEPGDKAMFLDDDGAGTNDVVQGAIGDCWFIGALSVLATEDKYVRGRVDPS